MRETWILRLPDLGEGVSFYQALGLTLEEWIPEREALLVPKEGPLLLLRPGPGGWERGPARSAEGLGEYPLRVTEDGLYLVVGSLEEARLRLKKYGLPFEEGEGRLFLKDPGGNPVWLE